MIPVTLPNLLAAGGYFQARGPVEPAAGSPGRKRIRGSETRSSHGLIRVLIMFFIRRQAGPVSAQSLWAAPYGNRLKGLYAPEIHMHPCPALSARSPFGLALPRSVAGQPAIQPDGGRGLWCPTPQFPPEAPGGAEAAVD